jgi:hypothetical protein
MAVSTANAMMDLTWKVTAGHAEAMKVRPPIDYFILMEI